MARALAEGARRAGWECRELPLADGGEGTLEVLGGANRSSTVTGPLGTPVEAGWRLEGGDAVVEMARASGLALVEHNDPVRATTLGTGQLIAAALAAGAERIVVAVGGSATTDGGLGAVEALGWKPFRVQVEVACDVRTPFLEAARVFGPQKGADPGQVEALSKRLADLAARYRDELGVDVTALPGAGAAGGLAGGLAALGAQLRPGFQLVAERAGLVEALGDVDLVLTGEGRLDATSFAGKVVGGVLELAAACRSSRGPDRPRHRGGRSGDLPRRALRQGAGLERPCGLHRRGRRGADHSISPALIQSGVVRPGAESYGCWLPLGTD